MSVYPGGFKVFTQKRNLLDDVDASHINDMQDEILATQRALGTNPVEEFNAPGGRRINYGSVTARITAVQRGLEIPYCFATRDAQSVKSGIYDIPLVPYASRDPYKMVVSGGIKLNQSGWWHVTAHTGWNGEAASSSKGHRMLRLTQTVGSDVTELIRDMRPASAAIGSRDLENFVYWQGYLGANTTLKLTASQTSGLTQIAHRTQFAVSFVRVI